MNSMMIPMLVFSAKKRNRKKLAEQLLFSTMMPAGNATQGQTIAFITADKNIRDAERGEEAVAREAITYVEEKLKRGDGDLTEAIFTRLPKFKELADRAPNVLALANSRVSAISNTVNASLNDANAQLTTDNVQLTTDNVQLTTDNAQLTTDNTQLLGQVDGIQDEWEQFISIIDGQITGGTFDMTELSNQNLVNILDLFPKQVINRR